MARATHQAPALRHRRGPGRGQPPPHDHRGGHGPRPGPRLRRPQRQAPPPDRHRQGHPPLGLHARAGPGRGDLLHGRRRDAHRAAADPGHRLPHPLHARRRRGGVERLSQPVPGQRDQVLPARRVQAPRRGGGPPRGLRARRGGRPGQAPAPHGQPGGQGLPHRRRRGPLRGPPEEPLPRRSDPRRPHGGRRLRQRGRLQDRAGGLRGARCQGGAPRASPRTAGTSTAAPGRCTPRPWRWR